MPKISTKFKEGHLNEGAKCRWGRLKSATFYHAMLWKMRWHFSGHNASVVFHNATQWFW